MSEDAPAPTTPVRPEQALPAAKLVAWAGLVTALIVLEYTANAASAGPPDDDILYRYSTALGGALQYALMLAIVLAISRGLSRETIGFRRPGSWPRALGLTLAGLVGIWVAGALLNLFLKAGEEQGLVPDDWDPTRAGPFVANFVAIAVVAPIVEETTCGSLERGEGRDREGEGEERDPVDRRRDG